MRDAENGKGDDLSYLYEERRREICENAAAGMEEVRRGELKSYSNTDDLMDSLNND